MFYKIIKKYRKQQRNGAHPTGDEDPPMSRREENERNKLRKILKSPNAHYQNNSKLVILKVSFNSYNLYISPARFKYRIHTKNCYFTFTISDTLFRLPKESSRARAKIQAT